MTRNSHDRRNLVLRPSSHIVQPASPSRIVQPVIALRPARHRHRVSLPRFAATICLALSNKRKTTPQAKTPAARRIAENATKILPFDKKIKRVTVSYPEDTLGAKNGNDAIWDSPRATAARGVRSQFLRPPSATRQARSAGRRGPLLFLS
ncbi:hypothetical protein SF83666_c25750 [Sinorhizobium fredii CCBAU 83666]|nr:hypothetical protein SF83666_c25750 [Sinorhizobium fredii CCBAU 83666]